MVIKFFIKLSFLLFMSHVLVAQSPSAENLVSTSSDEMWTKDQFRLFLVESDSSFSFTKNDEPLIDYINGKWLEREDTFFFFSNDSYRLLYFTIIRGDSIHRKVVHVDPRIYDSYQGKFPSYLYLNKSFYPNGAIHKVYDFIRNGDLSEDPEELKIQCFTEKGSIGYTLTINLKLNEAVYIEYLQNEHVYPKELVYGRYKNGIRKGLWYFNEYDVNGNKRIKTTKIKY